MQVENKIDIYVRNDKNYLNTSEEKLSVCNSAIARGCIRLKFRGIQIDVDSLELKKAIRNATNA